MFPTFSSPLMVWFSIYFVAFFCFMGMIFCCRWGFEKWMQRDELGEMNKIE